MAIAVKIPSSNIPQITVPDLQLISNSTALSPHTPLGRVSKVWLDIHLCLALREREGNWELTMASFILQ